MDEQLSKSIEKIKELVSKGDKDAALDEVNSLLKDPNMKPYENALKKIKVDIIYALNLERIDPNLGKKAYSRVASELDSVINPNAGVPPSVPKAGSVAGNKQARAPTLPVGPPTAPVLPAPVLPLPVVRVGLPKELFEKDPYDIDSIDITEEIGPMGLLNDMRRTIVSLFDPMLPMKLLKKETKNTR